MNGWLRQVACACMLIGVWGGSAGLALGETHVYSTTDPEIEMWFYPTGSANGLGSVRDRGPTFAAFSTTVDGGEVDFYEGSGFDPTRRGSFVVASNTSTTIPRLDDPARYQIDSVRMTVTLLGSIGPIAYDNTAEDMLALTTAGGDDAGRPIEMWGIGFDGDYTTFGFEGESEPEFFGEGDRRWPIAAGSFTGPYQLYSIDPEGRDVENAVVGGYSATEPDNHSEQFTPTPFAIGKVYDETQTELVPGTIVPIGSEFVFEPDLSNPGIAAYIQQSLAAGHLGFFFSSLHEPLGHTGTAPYPDFYLDNNPSGPNPNGNGPTLEILVTILDDLLPGDYDASGMVDTADYDVWKLAFGTAVAAGTGADGNGDGVVDAADYAVWRDNLGSGAGGGSVSTAVPEPSAWGIAALAMGAVAFVRGRRER